MFRFSHSKLILFSGFIWLAAGIYLSQYGTNLLLSTLPEPDPFIFGTHPLMELFSPLLGSRETVAVVIVLGCLMTGTVKCRFVLSRSVYRGINRILSLPNPSPLYKLYSPAYYLLIAAMITMGILLRQSGTPDDFRAACYLSIGFGMIRGSLIYFKRSLVVGKTSDQCESAVDLLD